MDHWEEYRQDELYQRSLSYDDQDDRYDYYATTMSKRLYDFVTNH